MLRPVAPDVGRGFEVSRTIRGLVVVAAVLVMSGMAGAAWVHLSRPAVLKVAVGPAGFADAELMAAFSRILSAKKSSVQLKVEHTAGPSEAVGKLINGEAQLAVMRGDGPTSDRIRAVAILHTDPVVIVVPESSKVDDFGDLKGKTVGLIGPPGADDALLSTLRKHYGVTGDTKALSLSPPEVIASIRDKAVGAVLFVVPTSRASRVAQTWLAVRDASRRKLAFVPIEDAAAIAAMVPAYEAGEIAAGQFGGSPMLPEESVTTLQVATYLVADRDVSNDAITQLTRSLLEDRQKLSADAPIATLIKAASTEKDAIFPVHPGAKAYYAGEETTLMERYGDWLFYGPMLLGALGSAGVTLGRFLRNEASVPHPVRSLVPLLAEIREAQTTSDIARIRTAMDAAIETMGVRATDEDRAEVTALTLTYINQALAERQNLLLAGSDQKRTRSHLEDEPGLRCKYQSPESRI